MKSNSPEQRAVRLMAIGLPLALLVFFFTWMELAAPRIKTVIDVVLGRDLFSVNEPFAIAISSLILIGPPVAIAFAVYAFVYYRWFIPKRSKLVAEQVEKLTLARKAMSEAVSYITTYEAELVRLSAEANARHEEVRLLKQLSSENATLLEERLRGMELLARNRIWFERAFAFVIGILSSIAASYIWIAIQPHP